MIVLLIMVILMCFAAAGIFAVISFLSGPPHSQRGVDGVYVPASFQDLSSDSSALAATSIHVPDVFNESRIKADLAVLANQPTLLAQYIAEAELRFTQARQIAVLQKWIHFYRVGEEVIVARTKLVRAHHDFIQVNREGEIKVKEKDVSLARLDAELEEVELRKAQARHARENLGKMPPAPEPPISAEEQRIVKKHRLQDEIRRLRKEQRKTNQMALTEEEKIRMSNLIDDRIVQIEEELAKYL